MRVILIPFDESRAIEEHTVTLDVESESIELAIKRLLDDKDYLETPLLRPRDEVAGLYAYFNNHFHGVSKEEEIRTANVRATRLAMACGLLSLRFFGNVLLIRGFGFGFQDLRRDDIEAATCISPDLRECIRVEIAGRNKETIIKPIPSWLANAAQNNYHDKAALAEVARAMDCGGQEEEDDEFDNASDEEEERVVEKKKKRSPTAHDKAEKPAEFVAKSSLCLHCRSLVSTICPDCEGAYFCCTPKKSCRKLGWSHSCLCSTWKVYTSHRAKLSEFPFFREWAEELTSRAFQTQEKPYAMFLKSLGIEEDCSSWWTTEKYGWGGGDSHSAKRVDASVRNSFAEGFRPIVDLPPERAITEADIQRANLARNSLGLVKLSSWQGYYSLRGIPNTSPVALLCTFPLTIYYSIMRYGEVPVTVARMLKRPLRVHVVGAEKEINFLDLFKEVIYLLPSDIMVR